MGNTAVPMHYADWDTSEPAEPGFSRILLSERLKGKRTLDAQPPGIKTMADAFRSTVARMPKANVQGTRDETLEHRPYKWRTFEEVLEITENLARGLMALDLVPMIEGDGSMWRFLGHYSINREEWMQLQIRVVLLRPTLHKR